MSPLLTSLALGGLFYALCDVLTFHGPLPRRGGAVLGAALLLHAVLFLRGVLPFLPATAERGIGILAGESLYYFLTLPARRSESEPAALFPFLFLSLAFAAIFSLDTAWSASAPARLAPLGVLALLFAWNLGVVTTLLGLDHPKARFALAFLLTPLEVAALR